MEFVTCRYLLHLQIAHLLSLAANVMFENIFSRRIVDVWNSLSDAIVMLRYQRLSPVLKRICVLLT